MTCKTLGAEAADAVFPPEQLAAQQAQILRRLEQLDEPARVISFPRFGRRVHDSGAGGRRVAVSWVAVAAAAGLVVGVAERPVDGPLDQRAGRHLRGLRRADPR